MSSYATLGELKVAINVLTASDDTILQAWLDAAEKSVNNFCNRPDGFLAPAIASARYYPGSGKAFQLIDETPAITAVAVKDSPTDEENQYVAWTVGVVGTTLAADVFPATGDPLAPDFTSLPYTLLVCAPNGQYSTFTSGRFGTLRGWHDDIDRGGSYHLPTVKVTAKWGYATVVPPTIKQASIMQAGRWYKRAQSAMADTLASVDLGALLYTKAVDPDIAMILVEGRYCKPVLGRR
jgi:hypothetical protein